MNFDVELNCKVWHYIETSHCFAWTWEKQMSADTLDGIHIINGDEQCSLKN